MTCHSHYLCLSAAKVSGCGFSRAIHFSPFTINLPANIFPVLCTVPCLLLCFLQNVYKRIIFYKADRIFVYELLCLNASLIYHLKTRVVSKPWAVEPGESMRTALFRAGATVNGDGRCLGFGLAGRTEPHSLSRPGHPEHKVAWLQDAWSLLIASTGPERKGA